MTFLYSTLSGPENVPAKDASELLGIARQLPRWDALIIIAENDNYPRLHITWHEAHGFVVHCFGDGESWGFFSRRPLRSRRRRSKLKWAARHWRNGRVNCSWTQIVPLRLSTSS